MDHQAGTPGSPPPAPWEADPLAPPPATTPSADPGPGKETPRPELPTSIRAIVGATFDAYSADVVPILALSALNAAVSIALPLAQPVAIVLLIMGPILTTIVVAIVADRMRTGSVNPGQAIAAGVRRAGWVLVWSLLVGLAVGCLGLIGVIGAAFFLDVASSAGDPTGVLIGSLGLGVVVAVAVSVTLFLLARWCLAVPAIVLDGQGPRSGSKQSDALVRGRTARFAALVALVGIVAYAPIGVAFLPALASSGDVIAAAVTGALGALTWPILPIACTVAYARLDRSALEPRRPRSRLAPVLAVAVGGVVAFGLLVGGAGAAALVADFRYLEANRGRVLAGTDLEIDRCRMIGARDRFEIGQSVAVLALLGRTLPAGEEIALAVFRGGAGIGTASEDFPTDVDCVGGLYAADDIVAFGGAGRYRLEYRLGDELLAAGEFEIVALPESSAAPMASPPPVTPVPSGLSTAAPASVATPAGTVRYGTGPGPDACRVAGEGARFTVGQRVYVAADLARAVAAGSEVRVAVRYGGAEIATDATAVLVETACLDGSLPTTGLPAGVYMVEYSTGGEVLAGGEFELIP